MKDLILIFFGGGLGTIFRFSLGRWVNTLHRQDFPWGTLVINIVACLVLGFVIGLADHKQFISPLSRLFWTVGFCGGFSTFSTFSYETLYLFQSGSAISGIAYIAASLFCCVAATFGGLYLGEHL